MYSDIKDDSENISPNSFIGSFHNLGVLADKDLDYNDLEKAYIPDQESVRKSRIVSGIDLNLPFIRSTLGDTLSNSVTRSLIKKYNKHIYKSPTADLNGSFFRIGPLTYGGEIQDIKILESKAIVSVPGVRSSNDFLTDDGSGDADISVTLLFSGKRHIVDGLVPLIALMKVSPITSVKNKIIESALYNKFSENAIEKPDVGLIKKLNKVLSASAQLQEHKRILMAIGADPSLDLVSETNFLKAQQQGVEGTQGKTYASWKQDIENLKYFERSPSDDFNIDASKKIGEELDKSRDPISRIDKTGHVPVAFMSMNISTHPEYVDTLVVNLMLKRIGVQNFLRDFLQYRDINNKPTPDATKAFWLNRAIDLYISTYYSSDPEAYIGSAFDLVNLQFTGDKLTLKYFTDNHKLNNLTLAANDFHKGIINRTPGTSAKFHPDGIAVTQLSFSISNKFAFNRLAGESYPTAQHMGFSSGNLTIAVKTNDEQKFKEIHTYKSAADFFIRSADRADRFNGWKVDCLLTRLFNNKRNPLSRSSDTVVNSKLFYPTNVASATTDMPYVRDVVMSLAETTNDFFSEFGFVLTGNGLTVDNMKAFYSKLVSRITPGSTEYANFIFLGSGNESEKFCLINPDTIIAAFLEEDYFGTITNPDAGLNWSWISRPSESGRLILEYLQKDSLFSGQFNSTAGELEIFLDQVNQTLTLPFNSVTLPDKVARIVLRDNFAKPDSLSDSDWLIIESELTQRISRLAQFNGKQNLYEYIFQQYNATHLAIKSNFFEHLFSALIKRAIPPLSDQLYERVNIANAYDSFERAVIVNADEIDSGASSDLSRSKALDNVIVYNPDGALTVSQRRITSYPDYFYLTFKELFSLPEFPDEYWQIFGYTYQDLGIINPNIKDYSDDSSRGLNMYTTSRAQSELVTTELSPVPPSIFFYRERELNDFRNNIEAEYREWFETLQTLRITIPYDVEFLLTEAGRITGERGMFDGNDIVPLDEMDDKQQRGLASLIEKQNEFIRRKGMYSDSAVKESGEDAIVAQFRKAKKNLGFGNITDREFYNKISKLRKESPHDILLQRYDKYLEGDTFEAFVPIVYATHKESDVAGYKKVSGTVGSIVYKDIIKRAATVNNQQPDKFLGDVLTKNASGFDDGISISNSHFDECYNGALKISQTIADNRNDLIKAFPVYRLYLIDYNRGDRIFVKDNFYGYNSIVSIDITLDKNDADLAQIRIADPLQILQSSMFKDKITWGRGEIGGITLPNAVDDNDRDNFLSRFELRQGRAIQIRGGYSADPDNLDILFTGKISEVQFGDIVTIIAQGWKAELLGKQVDFELTSVDNSSVKDLVVRVIRDANPAGIGSTLSQEELNQLIPYKSKLTLDSAIIRSIQNQFGTFGGDSGNSGFEGWLGLHVFGNQKQGLDLRLKNIWVPDNDKTRFNPLADIDTTGWEGDSWLIPLQPAWDVLQSATNYIWGYICQVVPYDGEATLFFGRPEQLYYYTKGNFKELTQYRKAHLRAQNSFTNTTSSLLKDFIDSPEFNGGSLLQFLNSQRDSAHSMTISNWSNTDYITMPIVINTWRGSANFEPNQISLLGYRGLYFGIGGVIGSTNSKTDTSYYKVSSLYNAEISDMARKNLSKDFYKTDFKIVSNRLGGDNNAAWLTFLTFYGFSEYFVNNYLAPLTVHVSRLLSSHNQESINSLKRLLQDSIPDKGVISKLNGIFGTRPQALIGADLSVYIENLKKLNTNQSEDFILTLNAYDGNTGRFRLYPGDSLKNNTSLSSDNLKKYLESLALYFSTHPNLGDINTSLSNLNVSVSNVFGPESGLITGLHLSIVVDSISQKDANNIISQFDKRAFKSLRNNIISYFEKILIVESSNLNELPSVFDERYLALSRKLSLTNQIDVNANLASQDIVKYIVDGMPMYRAYIHWLAQYLVTTSSSDDSKKKDNITSLAVNNYFQFPPALNMKPFRDYHYISSGVEIIQNNIGASTREMFNAIVVRGPKSITTDNDAWYKARIAQGDYDSVQIEDMEWQTWPNETEEGHIGWQFNDSLTLENKKLSVYTDLNVRRRDQAAKVATNMMAKLIRPMYRNNLLVMGRSIKPWDHIHLDDKYIQMWGPIEVERVVHHYSVSNGWVTNIVPHAVVEANPGNSAIQRALIANKFDKIYNIVDYALWAIVILTAIPTLGASAGAIGAAGRFGGSAVLRSGFIRELSFVVERQGLQEWASKFASKQLVYDKLITLRGMLRTNVPTVWRSYLYTQGITYGAGEMTRVFAMNSMSGPVQTPVSISPLLYKGIPFEAGLNGNETAYYSLASKLYWTYRDLKKGLDNVGSFLTDTFKTPSPSATNIFLESDSRIKRP